MPVEHSADYSSKKRAASDTDSWNTKQNSDYIHEESINGVQIDDEIDDLTMGDHLAKLNLINDDPNKPPSADSVHVLLKQALHADDRSFLLDCLFIQNQKVIANSVSLLNPLNDFKLFESLISMIQSRGAVLVCALPWLKSLLLQHSSSIMCQESSLIALNSLYQLIESRVDTCNPALQLLSSLDLLYTKATDEEREGLSEAIIYEDMSDEDENATENDEEPEAVSDISDLEINEF